MPASASTTSALIDDMAPHTRAREQLYVLCQAGGWGVFLGLQLVLVRLFAASKTAPQDELTNMATTVMVTALGLLLTHYARPLLARWGWKQLGWRAVVPRVLAISLTMSVLWSALGFGYSFGVLQLPFPSSHRLMLLFATSVINGTIMFVGWYCVYFCYHLFDRYNRLQIEQLRLAAHVKDSELRALKSQVNPHFIFNSLNSLRALIDEDPARARQSVTQLANLLRYSLQSSQLETVPFEDELRITNDYLALEQVRHEERLRVRLDIAPETLALPVPPMLLQTLVENAVKYGISVRPEGGEIAIIARCKDGALRLQVTNPGALPAAVAGTSAPLRTSAPASTGVGLNNAANRLRLLFGERATLQLRAASPVLVVAEAVLPLPSARA